VRVNKASKAGAQFLDDKGNVVLVVKAVSAGAWGNEIQVRLDESVKWAGLGRALSLKYKDKSLTTGDTGWNAKALRISFAPQVGEGDIYEGARLANDGRRLEISWSVRTPKPPDGQSKEWTPSFAFDGQITFTTTDADGKATAPGGTVTITVVGIDKATGAQTSEEVTINDSAPHTTTKAFSAVTSIKMEGTFGSATQLRIASLWCDIDLSQYGNLAVLAGRISRNSEKGLTAFVLAQGVTPVEELDFVDGQEVCSELSFEVTDGAELDLTTKPFGGQGVLTLKVPEQVNTTVTFTVAGVNAASGETEQETITIAAGSTVGEGSVDWYSIDSITPSGYTGKLTVKAQGRHIYRNLAALIDAVNGKLGEYVAAERAEGAGALPVAIGDWRSLAGGTDNIPASVDDWRQAIDLLRDPSLEIQHVVALTGDAAVQTAIRDHVDYMSGPYGGVARNAYVGFDKVPKRGEILERVRLLNSRNVALLAEAIKVFDENGEVITLPPYYTALLAAACDAGRLGGLTWRYVSIIDAVDGAIYSGASDRWTVSEDIEDLIASSVFLLEKRPEGIRWSRDVTTYVTDNNPIFCSVTANESANRSNESMRGALEQFIGNLGTAILPVLVKAKVMEELSRQVKDGEIKAYDAKSIEIEDLGNAFNIGYKIAVLESIYWITLTAHVVRMPSV
jgi:hypothetical protein